MKSTLYRTIAWIENDVVEVDECFTGPGSKEDKEWDAVIHWTSQDVIHAENNASCLPNHYVIEVELVEWDDGTFYVERDEHMFMGVWR